MGRFKYLIFLFTLSCTTPFEGELDFEQSFLVVEASFTTQLKQHQVLLSKSTPIEEDEQQPESNATVWIEDDSGRRFPFRETEPGTYLSDSVEAVVGNSYQLFITRENGEEYRSENEEVLPPAEIARTYGKVVTFISSQDAIEVSGVQFFVDLSAPGYYRFEYEEDHAVVPPLPSPWEFLGLELTPRFFLLDTCYLSDRSTGLLIGNSESEPLQEFPLRFIEDHEYELQFRYSIIARQFTINAKAYNYYGEIINTNTSAGTFFDSQKGFVPGNMMNISNPESPTIGYFEVASVSESLTFFSAEDFEEDGYQVGNRFEICFPDETRFEITVDALIFGSRFGNPLEGLRIYDVRFSSPDDPGTALVTLDDCADCTLYGTARKPLHWRF